MLIRGVFFLGDENIVGRSVLVLVLIFLLLFFVGGFFKGQVFLTILWGFSCRIQPGLKMMMMMMMMMMEIVQAVVGMVVISMYLFRFGELQEKVNSVHSAPHEH